MAWLWLKSPWCYWLFQLEWAGPVLGTREVSVGSKGSTRFQSKQLKESAAWCVSSQKHSGFRGGEEPFSDRREYLVPGRCPGWRRLDS